MSFREITIKEIACFTSLTRPSIYNYFQTKEEIFLALLQQEYERWRTDLEVLAQSDAPPSRQGLAQGLACTLERRPNMLRAALHQSERHGREEPAGKAGGIQNRLRRLD